MIKAGAGGGCGTRLEGREHTNNKIRNYKGEITIGAEDIF